jgi:hypothetical protein
MKTQIIAKRIVSVLLALTLAGSLLTACSLDRAGEWAAPEPPVYYGPQRSSDDHICISDFFSAAEAEEFLEEKIKTSTIDTTSFSWCCSSFFYTDHFTLIIKLYQEALVKPDDVFVGGKWHEYIEDEKAKLADRSDPNEYFYEAKYYPVDDVGDAAYITEFLEKNWWYYDIFYADYWMHIDFKYKTGSSEKIQVGMEDFQYIGMSLFERLKFLLRDVVQPETSGGSYDPDDLEGAIQDLPDYNALIFLCNRLKGYWTAAPDFYVGFTEGAAIYRFRF